MTISTYQPMAVLSPFIKHYLVIESQRGMDNNIMPDTSPVTAFRYQGHVSDDQQGPLPFALISGLRKEVRQIHYTSDTGNILVIFKELGASVFLKEPLHNFSNESIALDDLAGFNQLTFLEEQLSLTAKSADRIRLIEHFLLTKIQCQSTDRLVSLAIQKIRIAKGFIRIKSLANILCISQDAFEKQ